MEEFADVKEDENKKILHTYPLVRVSKTILIRARARILIRRQASEATSATRLPPNGFRSKRILRLFVHFLLIYTPGRIIDHHSTRESIERATHRISTSETIVCPRGVDYCVSKKLNVE